MWLHTGQDHLRSPGKKIKPQKFGTKVLQYLHAFRFNFRKEREKWPYNIFFCNSKLV